MFVQHWPVCRCLPEVTRFSFEPHQETKKALYLMPDQSQVTKIVHLARGTEIVYDMTLGVHGILVISTGLCQQQELSVNDGRIHESGTVSWLCGLSIGRASPSHVRKVLVR